MGSPACVPTYPKDLVIAQRTVGSLFSQSPISPDATGPNGGLIVEARRAVAGQRCSRCTATRVGRPKWLGVPTPRPLVRAELLSVPPVRTEPEDAAEFHRVLAQEIHHGRSDVLIVTLQE